MLKHLTTALILAAFVTGCGGSGGGGSKKSSSSSVVSSVASSVATTSSKASSTAMSSVVSSVASSAMTSVAMSSSSVVTSSAASSTVVVQSSSSAMSSATSVASSSSEASSSSMESSSSTSSDSNVITADMTAGWNGEGTGSTGVTYSVDGVSFNASADGIGASFTIPTPVLLENAVIEMVVNVSSEFKTSGANLQAYAQIMGAPWDGEWQCLTNNNELTAATDLTITCTIDEPADEFNQTSFDVKVGVLAKGTPTGIVTIKSAKVTLATQSSSSSTSPATSSAASSSSAGVSIDITTGWVDNGANTHTYSNDGVTYIFSESAKEVYTLAPAGTPLIGKTINFVMNVSPEYKASTAALKVFIQNTGTWDWMDLWINNSDLVAGVDTTYSFPIVSTSPALDGSNAFRVGLQPAAAAGGGTILIKSITVVPTP